MASVTWTMDCSRQWRLQVILYLCGCYHYIHCQPSALGWIRIFGLKNSTSITSVSMSHWKLTTETYFIQWARWTSCLVSWLLGLRSELSLTACKHVSWIRYLLLQKIVLHFLLLVGWYDFCNTTSKIGLKVNVGWGYQGPFS